MEDTYVQLINCRHHLFRSSASSFSAQYILLFLKSCKTYVLLLPTPFTSVICTSMASWRRQFVLRIWQSNWLFYVGYYLEVSSSLLYGQELHWLFSLTILSFPFSSSATFRSSPNTSASIVLVLGLWAMQCNAPNLPSKLFFSESNI